MITDPGSELGALARERGFAEVFENRPDIGGRYSALSLFGVVPGLLMGADVGGAAPGGLDALAHSAPDGRPRRQPGPRPRRRDRRRRAHRPRQGHLRPRPVARRRSACGSSSWSPSRWARTAPAPCRSWASPSARPTSTATTACSSRQAARSTSLAGGRPPGAWSAARTPSPHGIGHLAVTMELAVALAGAAIGVQPVRPARRRRRQGRHRRGAAPRAVPTSRSSRSPTSSPSSGPATTSRCRPSSIPVPRDRRGSKRRAWRCATGTGSRRASASAPASCTPPASCTRADRPPIVCVQVVGDDPTRSPSPASRSASATSSRRRPPATCAPSRPRGIRAGRGRPRRARWRQVRRAMKARHGRPRAHGREHGRAPPRPRPRGGRLRRLQRRHRRRHRSRTLVAGPAEPRGSCG